jgi:hypothetical protein
VPVSLLLLNCNRVITREQVRAPGWWAGLGTWIRDRSSVFFLFIQTAFHYIVQAGFKLTMKASLESAEITGMHHHSQPPVFLFVWMNSF